MLVLNQPLPRKMVSGSASGDSVDLKNQMDPELRFPVRERVQTFHCEIIRVAPDVKFRVYPVRQLLPFVESHAAPDNLPDAPLPQCHKASDCSPDAGYLSGSEPFVARTEFEVNDRE